MAEGSLTSCAVCGAPAIKRAGVYRCSSWDGVQPGEYGGERIATKYDHAHNSRMRAKMREWYG